MLMCEIGPTAVSRVTQAKHAVDGAAAPSVLVMCPLLASCTVHTPVLPCRDVRPPELWPMVVELGRACGCGVEQPPNQARWVVSNDRRGGECQSWYLDPSDLAPGIGTSGE